MSQQAPAGNIAGNAREPRVMESIINELQAEVCRAEENSNDLKDIGSRLLDFTPNCDMEKMEKSEVKPDAPEGIVRALNTLIDSLNFINRRNAEVIKHLSLLI
jgi:hypothetical protein